ncbi:LysR family transcriptional regulator [Paenibacillus hamazuiensis]|uniref:LysR family transcriptional regulator n=1 Tax=Paenibacillus hamazuiensis TaxID=2936508 RepID=UPI00200DCBAE|nr:LysR family transcriptional regulator [Paenibacillus hamazuiensis]
MEEKDWIILKLLYDERNITKTAKHLYLSQPSLSHRLNQIEKEFGVTLFHRGRRGVEFTEQGEVLAQYANEMLQKLAETKEKLWNLSGHAQGTLRLACSRGFALYKLPQVLKKIQSSQSSSRFNCKNRIKHGYL